MHGVALLVGHVEKDLRVRVRVVESRHDDLACPLLVAVVGDERSMVRNRRQRNERDCSGDEIAKGSTVLHDEYRVTTDTEQSLGAVQSLGNDIGEYRVSAVPIPPSITADS